MDFFGQKNPKMGERAYDLFAYSDGFTREERLEMILSLGLSEPAIFDPNIEDVILYFPLPGGRWAFCLGVVERRKPFNSFLFHVILLDKNQF